MKRILLVFALIGFASFAVQAQSCCDKGAKGTSSAAKSEASCSQSAAVKAASLDDSIEQRVDENSGKVSFVRRTVNASTGEASFIPVEYCSESKAFKTVDSEKASCHGDAKASTTSATGAKAACCADGKGKEGAACCAKDSKAKTSSTSVKLNKTNN
ncbi:MAG: hypothetical protein IPL49_07625 [Saprospirales bacterium]|nr:hypothetical protein [Saprospirales bacterium]MBK8490753.1 hypothetical protein [Saprospirales bacterium]